MNQWQRLSQPGILLFCDAVWMYFGLQLLSSIIWGQSLTPHPLIWTGAPFLGFIVGLSTTKRREGWIFFIHCIVLAVILLPHWTLFYVNILSYSLVVSVALAYLYIRSSIHVAHKPTRLDMMLRFEGTVVFYCIFVLVNQNQQLYTASFHITFFFTLIMSLLGMMLTLYEKGDVSENGGIETKTAGRSTPLPVIIGGLLGTVAIVSLLLFIPTVQTTFVTVVNAAKNGAIWVSTQLYAAFVWFVNLFPSSNVDDTNLTPPDNPGNPEPPSSSTSGGELPLMWIIIPLLILGVLAALWVSSRLIRQWRPSAKGTIRKTTLKKEPFWKTLWHRLRKAWRKRSPHYYEHNIYWHFHLLTNWAKKQGISRQSHETAQDFTQRITQQLDMEENTKEKVLKLGEAYSAVHYSKGTVVPEYDAELLTALRGIRAGTRRR
ncbi:DUF4129 domain-containing protein [Salibacterium salarium]|uniref:DUF4129 domain-containing protein n=1 Tax=Salibacterium salarium TaxID=284579 RepID=A0A428NAG2_9BACI|nr:DUF4129 domain-containing protein [Salibacterium salarium]RSL35374.1 DUF4129 domain-containing protein [Salibacterium salarium]